MMAGNVRKFADLKSATAEALRAQRDGCPLAHVVEHSDPMGTYYTVKLNPGGFWTAPEWLIEEIGR